MKKMISAIVLSASIFGSFQASAQNDVDCNNAQSTYEMNECAGREYEKADAELNAVYKAINSSLRQQLKGTKDKSELKRILEIQKRILASQRAWVAFKKVNTEMHGVTMLGGSGETLLQIGAATRMTKERIDELKGLLF